MKYNLRSGCKDRNSNSWELTCRYDKFLLKRQKIYHHLLLYHTDIRKYRLFFQLWISSYLLSERMFRILSKIFITKKLPIGWPNVLEEPSSIHKNKLSMKATHSHITLKAKIVACSSPYSHFLLLWIIPVVKCSFNLIV